MPLVLPRGRQLPSNTHLDRLGVRIVEGVEPDVRIGLLNLMPAAARDATVEQFFGLIGLNSLNIEPVLVRFDEYVPKTGRDEFLQFYSPLADVQAKGLDGLIVSGANLETDPGVKAILPVDKIFYMPEQAKVMDWARSNVRSTIYSCHGAHVALEHFYGLTRSDLGNTTFNRASNTVGTTRKTFGVFKHTVDHSAFPALTRGMNDQIWAPQSRWGDVPLSGVKEKTDLHVVAVSEESGWHMLVGPDAREVYLQGHPEYYTGDLAGEYNRDKGKGLNPKLPNNYFPNEDDSQAPPSTWRSDGHVLYRNWLEFLVSTKPARRDAALEHSNIIDFKKLRAYRANHLVSML